MSSARCPVGLPSRISSPVSYPRSYLSTPASFLPQDPDVWTGHHGLSLTYEALPWRRKPLHAAAKKCNLVLGPSKQLHGRHSKLVAPADFKRHAARVMTTAHVDVVRQMHETVSSMNYISRNGICPLRRALSQQQRRNRGWNCALPSSTRAITKPLAVLRRLAELEDELCRLRSEIGGLRASRETTVQEAESTSRPLPGRSAVRRDWSPDGVDDSESITGSQRPRWTENDSREQELNLFQLNAPITAINALTPDSTTTALSYQQSPARPSVPHDSTPGSLNSGLRSSSFQENRRPYQDVIARSLLSESQARELFHL